MCSIIGWNGPFDEETIKKICFNSRIRGLHAFGYSFYKNKKITTLKFLNYDEFISSLIKTQPKTFIAHFRYSTSGDYKNELNNQPIEKKGVSMVFNGVLDMRTKTEMEDKYKLSLDTENDGELALIKFLSGENNVKDLIKGRSFAGAFLDKDGKIKVLRNTKRPAYIGKIGKASVLSSTKDILLRSGVKEIDQVKKMEVTEL